MALDYTLVAISGIAVFAQAMLGLLVTTRPPSEARRIWYEIAFGVIGALGLVAIVWGGIRTVQSSSHVEKSLGYIESADSAAAGQLTRIASAMQLNPNQSAQALATEILKRLPSTTWYMTPEQKARLSQVLDAIPAAKRFKISVSGIPSSAASLTFMSDLVQVFRDHHWDATGTQDFRLRPDFTGIGVGYDSTIKDSTEVPQNLKYLFEILSSAGLNPKGGKFNNLGRQNFVLVVGTRAD